MKRIDYRVIPHLKQRYVTVGDYFTRRGVDHFRISDTGDERYNDLIGLHEFVERILCFHAGITNEAIDRFDMAFEAKCRASLADGNDEPGDDPAAPYHKQHMIASQVERMIAFELGVKWKDYEKAIAEL